jgi:sulfate/thiosulfate transport system substrate-binding protein
MSRLTHLGPGEAITEGPTPPLPYRLLVLVVAASLLALVVFHSGPALISGYRTPVKLVVYGFSTQEDAFLQDIFPAFEDYWEARNGRDLIIEGVFGPSGTLANQILMGAPADVAIFSNAQHVTWLKVGKLTSQDTEPVIVGCTPMVIVTRLGSPLNLNEFVDLSMPGLKLVHAEPGPAGAGDWAILAEYGSAYLDDRDHEAALAQLEATWANVAVLGSSARATLTLFELGAGDALVTYEQDALRALDRGVPVKVTLPSRTIVAQYMAVIVDANVTSAERAAAEDFIRYLLSDAGQAILRHYRMRPPEVESPDFDPISEPFTIEDLGGWPKVYRQLVDGWWKQTMLPQLTTHQLPYLLNGQD